MAVAAAGLVSACGGNPVKPTPPPPELPKISCPAASTAQSPTGQPTPISYGTATSTGGAPPVTISCSPASGSMFPVGSTTVTCSATDQLGRSDACTFAVTVTEPPRLAVTTFLAFGDSMTWGQDGLNSFSLSAGVIHPWVQLPFAQT